MHILVSLSSLLGVIFLASLLNFRLLHRFKDWSERRRLQLLILLLPLASLGVLLGGLVHVNTWGCSLSWDHVLDGLLLLFLGITLLGALIFGGIRLLLLKWLMQRKEILVDPALQARVDWWASRRGIGPVRIRLTRSTRPLALLYGMRQPTVLLSTWMLEHLDDTELEAVLAHELEHVSRRDYLFNWCALLLRDAFFYLPTSRRAYWLFRREKELACDDLVVSLTRRPLALASALTKVWLHLVDHPSQPSSPLVQSLLGTDEPITRRLDRLLASQSQATSQESSPFSLGVRLSVIGSTCFVVAMSLVLICADIWCWFGVLTFRIF